MNLDKTTEEKVIKTINEVMSLDVTKLDKKKKLSEISEWDSFNNLMLVSRFQDDYNIEFTAAEIEDAQTIADIFTLLEKKLG
jgi:acyl carrier protein